MPVHSGGCCACEGETASICVGIGTWDCEAVFAGGLTIRYQGPGGYDETIPVDCTDYDLIPCLEDAPAGAWTITVDGPALHAPYVESFTLGATETKIISADLLLWFNTVHYEDDKISLTLPLVPPSSSCFWDSEGLDPSFEDIGVNLVYCPGDEFTEPRDIAVDGQNVTVPCYVSVFLRPSPGPACEYEYEVSVYRLIWLGTVCVDCEDFVCDTEVCTWTSLPDGFSGSVFQLWLAPAGSRPLVAGGDVTVEGTAGTGTECPVTGINYTLTLSYVEP